MTANKIIMIMFKKQVTNDDNLIAVMGCNIKLMVEHSHLNRPSLRQWSHMHTLPCT